MRKAVAHTIRSIRPDIATDKVDYLRTESNSEIGAPIWGYDASSNTRLAVGPCNQMLSDNTAVDFMGLQSSWGT